jgi:hypothetical protein
MSTPKSVQRQLEQAEAAQAQIAAQAQANSEVVTDETQFAQAPAAPQPVAAQAPAPVSAPPADAVDWQKRYQSLQGMYNAEIPRLQTQTKVFESQVAVLTEQVRALTAAATRPPPEPQKPAVDPRDVETFGESMMEMVQRHMNNAVTTLQTQVSGAIANMDGRLKALEGSVQGVHQRAEESLESQFWTALSTQVPDYEALNDSDGWKAWLAEVDPLTGAQRQALLQAAQKALDAKRVAVFFKAYKATIPPPPSAALNSQVSPSAGGAAAAPTPTGAAPVFTQKFISDFYNELTRGPRGKYHGREAEAARITAAIDLAAVEGRIR